MASIIRHPIWRQLKLALPLYHASPALVEAIARAAESLGGGPVLGRSNVYTWRTRDYMLASTQVTACYLAAQCCAKYHGCRTTTAA